MVRQTIILVILFLSQIMAAAQPQRKIVQVGAGEYLTTYRTDDGDVFMTTRIGNNKYQLSKLSVKNIIDVAGAQYTIVALDTAGAVSIIGINQNGQAYIRPVPVDSDGNPFVGNTKVYGWFVSYLSIKNDEIFMWGEDILNINAGVKINSPMKLQTPAGKKIRKLVPLSLGEPSLMALGYDGSVWIYSKKNKTPVRVKLPAARDIAGIGSACFVVETKDDLFAWGYLGSYLGAPDLGNVPVSIKKNWVAAGCVFPSKELVGNYNTLHIIDANDNMFGAGDNIQGEIGNGQQYPDWKKYPTPYAWSWKHGEMISKPVQIMGKFKNICTSNSVTFYHYVQDMGDNWYSWGRNKARSLGNGITFGINEEAIYPDALNVPAPTLVKPLEVKWKLSDKMKKKDQSVPIANAGINQYISSNSTTLYGSSSSQQGDIIKKFHWLQISGDPAKIISPDKADTKVTGLKKGPYTFSLTVTNSLDVSSSAEVMITVLN